MAVEFKKNVMSTSGVKIKKLGKRPVASFLCEACGCEFEQNTKYCTEFKLGHYIMTEDGEIDAEYDAKAKCPSCGMEQIRNGPELKEKTPFEKMCPKW